MMGMRLPSVISNARKVLRLQSLLTKGEGGVPKGHIAVYVGENDRIRYVVPLSFLSHPSFQDLLRCAEEEFGFYHPMGGLTIPCKEEEFIDLTCRLNSD